MGLTLPGASSMPAPDSCHHRMAADCGRRIVDMVWEDLTLDRIVTAAAVRNAAIVAMATVIANVRPSGKDYLMQGRLLRRRPARRDEADRKPA